MQPTHPIRFGFSDTSLNPTKEPLPTNDQEKIDETKAAEINSMKKDVDALEAATSLRKIEDDTIIQAIGKKPFVISSEKIDFILELTGLSKSELLQRLVPIAKTFARPPISKYMVGAAALGKSGNIYLGVNLEFPGFHLNQSVHGEQFIVALARMHDEEELSHLALSAAPCGHCRQFLNELGGDSSLQILTPGQQPRSLSEFLPDAFGPKDLGLDGGLLTARKKPNSDYRLLPLECMAIAAAQFSYAPYSQSLSGVAIQTENGVVYSGEYMENAAFNPSLSPFHSALVALVADGRSYDEIERVILVESLPVTFVEDEIEVGSPLVSHAILTEAILKSIAPDASFKKLTMQSKM